MPPRACAAPLKPGGHGVIWKLAREEGVFDWLLAWGRKKALVRQINNPVANTDHGLFAFTGIGCFQDKAFGFASCPRQVRAAEGINILVEKEEENGYGYVLTNIEYCDFKRLGIADKPAEPGSSYSLFPSNTNILFADLSAVLAAVRKMPHTRDPRQSQKAYLPHRERREARRRDSPPRVDDAEHRRFFHTDAAPAPLA